MSEMDRFPPARPGTQHIMEWDDYDAACEAIDRARQRHLTERSNQGDQ